jgi:ABC-type transport system involved in multi-copper enzyme maturation permease subunit
MSNVPVMAAHEFSRLARSPLVIFVVVVICLATVINAAGCSVLLQKIDDVAAEPFMSGIGNLFYFSSIFFSFLALCMAVMVVSGDRSAGALRVLVTKPLRGRDIIAGKLLGMNALLLVLISLFVILGALSLVVAYGMPRDVGETSLKLIIFWGGLFLFCSLITMLTTFLGVVFRELIGVLAISVSFLVIAWFARLQYVYAAVGKLELINPVVQYVRISAPVSGCDIFNPYVDRFAFPVWLGAAIPVTTLIVAEIIMLFAASCLLFKDEEK